MPLQRRSGWSSDTIRKGHIQLYRLEPGQKVGVITIHCTPVGEEQTHVDVAYEHIAISAEGQRFVAGFTLATYEAFINEWREWLVQYFDPK